MAIKRKVKKAESIKPIPADIYPAKLVSITEGDGDFGKYFKLEFEITDGSYSGEKRTIIASDKLSRGQKGGSKLLGILETLTGKQLDFDQEIDLESYLGSKCRILVAEAVTKGDIQIQNVEKVMPPKE